MHINTKTASHASWNCFHSGNLLSLLERWKSICCWVGKLGPDYYCFNWHLAFNWLRTKNWITQTLIGKRSGIFYVYVQLNLGVFSSRPEICEHETGLVQSQHRWSLPGPGDSPFSSSQDLRNNEIGCSEVSKNIYGCCHFYCTLSVWKSVKCWSLSKVSEISFNLPSWLTRENKRKKQRCN